MGVQSDTYEIVRAVKLTQIEGVMTQEDCQKLMREACAGAAKIVTTLGDRKLGMGGLILPNDAYIERSEGGVKFIQPENPGVYPESLSNSTKEREHQVAQHKAKVIEYEKVLGVENALRDAIIEAVPEMYLAEIMDTYLGLSHKRKQRWK